MKVLECAVVEINMGRLENCLKLLSPGCTCQCLSQSTAYGVPLYYDMGILLRYGIYLDEISIGVLKLTFYISQVKN